MKKITRVLFLLLNFFSLHAFADKVFSRNNDVVLDDSVALLKYNYFLFESDKMTVIASGNWKLNLTADELDSERTQISNFLASGNWTVYRKEFKNDQVVLTPIETTKNIKDEFDMIVSSGNWSIGEI